MKFLNLKTMFLFDGIGAALSALLTGLILPIFSEYLGLSHSVLYFLAAFPCVYLIYSFCCYFLFVNIRPWMLALIILANLLYCLVSGYFVFFYESTTSWGVLLLSLEMLVIAVVVFIESKVYRREFIFVEG
jgi:hypothetical protein